MLSLKLKASGFLASFDGTIKSMLFILRETVSPGFNLIVLEIVTAQPGGLQQYASFRKPWLCRREPSGWYRCGLTARDPRPNKLCLSPLGGPFLHPHYVS